MTVFLVSLATFLLWGLTRKNKKYTSPAKTEEQKQADELVTVILPTINNDH